MVFSSNLFLFVFLPIFLLAYFATPARFKSALILGFSYAFYAWWRPDFLILLMGVSIGSYVFSLAIDKQQDDKKRYRILTIGVALNLCTLAYFKYANFGIESLNIALATINAPSINWAPVLLPIGLSFYIFHAISYLVDIYRREAPPAKNLIDFSAFIALYPHLVAGPVLRYHLLAEQFRSRAHSIQIFARGCTVFMLGFCQKVLIADSVAPLADAAFAAPFPTMADAWLGTIAYTVQLFFDFSGYSTMAIGLALMIGFKFPENFNDPYTSTSITEFWQRWHMSLSSWLREYLYVPLGGNRKGTLRTYINLFLTMVLGGLWHGANWTFLIWGAWHGAVLAIERYCKSKYGVLPIPRWVLIAKTMIIVMIGWVFFRAHNVTEAIKMLKALAGQGAAAQFGSLFSHAVAWQVTNDRLIILVVSILLVYLLPIIKRHSNTPIRFAILPLFIWSVATLSAQTFTPFLYFQF